MALKDLLGTIVHTPTSGYTSFALAPNGDRELRFVPNQTYVEIRLTQMRLRDKRVLWRDFIPLASLLTEFQFAGERQVVPFVVGPDLLARAPHHEQGDMVEFFGRRIAGPFPYLGDDVVIFSSLARLETENWAKRAMSLLGTVASAFDVSKISSYLDIAGGLTNALQDLLGMHEVEQRLGVERSYKTAPENESDSPPEGSLRPCYEVFIRADPGGFPPERRQRMAVNEGRLQEDGRDFDQADFMVLELIPLTTRSDYASFPFHRVHWKQIEQLVTQGHVDDAWQRFTLLAVDLVQTDDLVTSHRDALLQQYSEDLKAAIARREQVFARGGSHGFEDRLPTLELDEPDLAAAIERRAGGSQRSPEEMLSSALRVGG